MTESVCQFSWASCVCVRQEVCLCCKSSATLLLHGFSPFGAIEIANFCLCVLLEEPEKEDNSMVHFFLSEVKKTVKRSGDRRRKGERIKGTPLQNMPNRNVLFQKRHVEGRRGSSSKMGHKSTKDRLLKFTAFPNGRHSPVMDWKWQ